MITVSEAIGAILDGVRPLGVERVSLTGLSGRIVAQEVRAAMTQPPFAASAMDGYAIRFDDMKSGATLRVIGEAPAGTPFDGEVGPGEAVRIFTGGAVPGGADHIIIQEDVTRSGNSIVIEATQEGPRNMRPAGIDFETGDVLANAGERLHEIHGAIFAAANIPGVEVFRRPRISLFSNGDELKDPGSELKPGQIINSNHYALCDLIRNWGGEADYLGCAADSEASIRAFFQRGRGADIIIPVGGASVGDYDLVKSAFAKESGAVTFEKVAVRPGKPTWSGALGSARVIGLPGNPASAIVTAALFVQPLVRRLAGEVWSAPFAGARLTAPITANGGRESYLRATVDGGVITPASNQDSSLLRPFAKANALIKRVANAPAAEIGDEVEFIRLR